MKTKKALRIAVVTMLVSVPFVVRAQQTVSNSGVAYQHNLMPVPSSVQFLEGRFGVSESFKVAATGYADARLQAAIDRFLKRFQGRTGLTLAPGLTNDSGTATLLIQCG